MSSVASTLISIAQQALTAVTGGLVYRKVFFVAHLDLFAVNSSTLTARHKQIMDGWIAGGSPSVFPFVPGAANHKLVLIAGMASRTGPEENNLTLSEQRARKVYDYLAAGLDSSQLIDNVKALGSSRAREGFETAGSEFAENRAVGIVLEIQVPIVGVVPPSDPPTPPPAPKSREWELGITGLITTGDPIPIVDAVGLQYITGTLRNVRTEESRSFRIVAGGINLGISAAPIDIGINLQGNELTPFNTHWSEFEDFDNTMVVLVGAGATDVYDFSAGAIGFLALNTTVEPAGLVLKTNIGVSAQLQYGMFMLDNS